VGEIYALSLSLNSKQILVLTAMHEIDTAVRFDPIPAMCSYVVIDPMCYSQFLTKSVYKNEVNQVLLKICTSDSNLFLLNLKPLEISKALFHHLYIF
jgi:hypothetical protein